MLPRAPFEIEAELFRIFLEAPHQILLLSHGVALTSDRNAALSSAYPRPKRHPPQQASSIMRATKLADNILSLRAIASMLSESVLASALAQDTAWSSRFRFHEQRHRRSMGWWASRSLL